MGRTLQNRELAHEYLDSIETSSEISNKHESSFFENSAVLTVTDVAYLLRSSVRTVERLLRDGKIPARKVGRKWIILRKPFERWLTNSMED
jgi:excisionase family DNA binding protein